MSNDARSKPMGTGWKKNRLPKGCQYLAKWTHQKTGVVKINYEDYVEIQYPKGERKYSGEGGGVLLFCSDGTVTAYWNGAAALASSHGSGNRTSRITKAAGRRKPAMLDETFALVSGIRSPFIIPSDHKADSRDIPGLPHDADGQEALELLKVFRRESYLILSAIVNGDASFIRDLAAAVENHENLRTGRLQTPISDFSDWNTAIKQAAEEADGIPSRSGVLRKYEKIVGLNRGSVGIDGARERLALMGFGWLHAAHGKRGKRVG